MRFVNVVPAGSTSSLLQKNVNNQEHIRLVYNYSRGREGVASSARDESLHPMTKGVGGSS